MIHQHRRCCLGMRHQRGRTFDAESGPRKPCCQTNNEFNTFAMLKVATSDTHNSECMVCPLHPWLPRQVLAWHHPKPNPYVPRAPSVSKQLKRAFAIGAGITSKPLPLPLRQARQNLSNLPGGLFETGGPLGFAVSGGRERRNLSLVVGSVSSAASHWASGGGGDRRLRYHPRAMFPSMRS